jgi:Ni/Co efflux regulator RcnB
MRHEESPGSCFGTGRRLRHGAGAYADCAPGGYRRRAAWFAHAADATYDLRIFEAVERELFFVPAREIYRREALPRASHRLEQALEPCGRYFWTVRAVFRLAGATRVTEWSGAYNVYNVQVDPSRWRRGEYQAPMMRQDRFFHPLPGMQPDWFYYPMRAPTAHGADDCGN